MPALSVLLCGSEGEHTMKLMNGTDQTKGLRPSLTLQQWEKKNQGSLINT